MKKILKILIISAVLLTTAIVFTTCKQFIDNPEEFLSYWASEAVIDRHIVISPAPSYAPGSSIPCVPSAGPVTVTMKVHNPKNFSFMMPNYPGAPSDIVRFGDGKVKGSGGAKPVYGTDYTLEPISDGKALKLTYTNAFLKANEWSSANIGSTITLYSTDGRKFNQTYSFDLEANTPPPEIGDITIAQTANDRYYVLCFTVQDTDMNTTIAGGNLHKDLVLVISKENGGTTTIPLPIGSSGFAVDPANGLLSSASQIIAPVPSGTWKVYFKTDTELTASTLPQKYTVRLTDKKGLSSEPKEAKTLGSIPDISVADTAWKNLKQAVENASENGVITVMGNVKATSAPGNSGQIEISKDLTIRGKKEDGSDTLDANSDAGGKAAHRIFKITGAARVQMENLTLINGKETSASYTLGSGGGGILMDGKAYLRLTGVTIRDCTSKAPGGGLRMDHDRTGTGGGELRMENVKVIHNTVKNDDGGSESGGGGIALPNHAYKVVIDNSEISYNTVDVSAKTTHSYITVKACGLYAGNTPDSKTYIKGHTVIEGNGYVKHASTTTNVQGIGMWMQGGVVTIGEDGKSDAESPLIQNHQVGAANDVKGTAIYLDGGAKVYWKSGQIKNNSGENKAIFEGFSAKFDNQTEHTAN